MWNNVNYVRPKAFGIVFVGFNFCVPKRSCFGLGQVSRNNSNCSNRAYSTQNYFREEVRKEPPWRVLFFGTDEFAVQSLRSLTASRHDCSDKIVESLEVVTLGKDLPVRRFANDNKLVVHDWPHVSPHGRFDVGVVVSFGCLLRESLIRQFPYGILNVHPSLLPRWRGPAPVFHTVLHGDTTTGVTIMQIRPKRFDVGPILNQEIYQVPEQSTADQLGANLSSVGARLLIDTLKNLPERIANGREQSKEGVTMAPKISTDMSWVVWEEQTCDHISCLFRAIGSRIPLRTFWMGDVIKLLDFVGKVNVSESEGNDAVPGSIRYQKESNTVLVRCKDGWVGFRALLLRKRLSAADFYNGYLHHYFVKSSTLQHQHCLFQSKRTQAEDHSTGCSLPHQNKLKN